MHSLHQRHYSLKTTSGIALVILVGIFVICSLAFPQTPTAAAAVSSPTPTPRGWAGEPFKTYKPLLLQALSAPGMPKIKILEVNRAGDRDYGEPLTVGIVYETPQTTQQALNNEWIVLLSAVAKVIKTSKMDTDRIALGYNATKIGRLGLLMVDAKDLMAFYDKKITRAEFLNRAKLTQDRYNVPSLTPTPKSSTTKATPTPTKRKS